MREGSNFGGAAPSITSSPSLTIKTYINKKYKTYRS